MNPTPWYDSTTVRLLAMAAVVAAFGLLTAVNPSMDDLVRSVIPGLLGYFFGTRKAE